MPTNPKKYKHQRLRERLERRSAPTLQNWRRSDSGQWEERDLPEDVIVECGWGRLLFGHTYKDLSKLADSIRLEKSGRRDIAFYLSDPHVVLSMAPQELFLDPSHTYRLWMDRYRPASKSPKGFQIRRLKTRADAEAVNAIYAQWKMVQVDLSFYWDMKQSRKLTYLVAEDEVTGEVIGSVMGVDHVRAYGDPENGSSLWCLAVDSQTTYPGVGEALVRQLSEHFAARGRAYMDLSVLHDNQQAIALYDKLGFERVPVFAVKNKNSINEKLFVGPPVDEALNPYAMIIINEARRRGIHAEVLDAEGGFFKLTQGGRSIICRESLSQLTDAVAMSRCDDKAVTRRLMEQEEIAVPAQLVAGDEDRDLAFMRDQGSVVVKPARGEQGRGISVDVTTPEDLQSAIRAAREVCDTVLLEEYVEGHDLRVIVIGYRVVAAAIRKPPEIVGTGRHSIKELIAAQSRRREKATGGESRIPVDDETRRVVRAGGYSMDDVLGEGEKLRVRKTANLHTGGTIHDVTERLHHRIVDAATRAARAIEIPVVGLDFIVPRVDDANYVIIEANERPGLANHEPQPTAERFIDLLFPQTAM